MMLRRHYKRVAEEQVETPKPKPKPKPKPRSRTKKDGGADES